MNAIYTKREILLENVDFLVEKINKLNRKAQKFGLPKMQYFVEPSVRYTEPEDGKVQAFVEVELFGEVPKINGWQLVARIEHNNDPDYPENVVAAAPGHEVPAHYRTADSECNHCNHKRYRSNTYILINPEGEYKQVGSSCLVDYIGKMTANSLLNWFTWEKTVGEWFEAENGMRQRWSFHLPTVIAYTLGCIEKFGWTSVSKAKEEYGVCSTASDVSAQMDDKWRQYQDKAYLVDAAPYMEKAQQVIEWGKTLVDDGDYTHKIITICNAGVVPQTLFGLSVSIPAAYNRAMEEIEKKAAKKPSEYVGEVGQKIKVSAKCTGIWTVDSFYGPVDIIKFLTEEGEVIVWKTGSSVEVETGKVYNIEGKVKEHSTFRDEKQTVITRPKVVAQ